MPNAVQHNALNGEKKTPLNICCWPDRVGIFLGGNIILKRIWRNWTSKCELDVSGSSYGPVAEFRNIDMSCDSIKGK
jgi:hypothetical protein